MCWNDGYERRKFEARQKKQAEEYRALGMTEEQIKAMYEFDLEQYKSDRRYYSHTQSFVPDDFDEDEDDDEKLSIFDKFKDVLTTSIEESGNKSRYWWFEEIDNPDLVRNIKSLSTEQLELLTLVVIDGYGQAEIAELMKVSQSAISQRIATIRKLLKATRLNHSYPTMPNC